MTPGDQKEYSTFFLAFVGQRITITTDIVCSSDLNHGGPTLPLYFDGILLDYDDEYFYLGETNDPNQITQAIPRGREVHIHAIEEEDIYGKMLESMPEPDDKNEVN